MLILFLGYFAHYFVLNLLELDREIEFCIQTQFDVLMRKILVWFNLTNQFWQWNDKSKRGVCDTNHKLINKQPDTGETEMNIAGQQIVTP